MIKTGCEVICMSWDFHEILSVGILKNVIPNLEIKFVDEFTNDPRTWKIDSHDDVQFGYFLTYCNICDTYQIDNGDKYTFLSNIVSNDKIINIIDEIEPKTSIFDIWKEGFLYAVDIASVFVKAKNFKKATYHSCCSWFEDAEDGYAIIEDEDSPWENIVENYPDIKFVIIDLRKSYEHERDTHDVKNNPEGLQNINAVHRIDLRYKVKPICENQEYRIPVFRNDDEIIIDSDTEQYSVIEPKKSWRSFTLLDEVSFEFLNQAERFVKSMINKYNEYIEDNKDMKENEKEE